MNTIRVSATKARNNFFQLLDQVAAGKEVIIEKDKKEVARLQPAKKQINWKRLLAASEKVHGIWKDEPYDPEDNPLRRKGAKDFLYNIDKELSISLNDKDKK
jgi:prevent-host-death family protein